MKNLNKRRIQKERQRRMVDHLREEKENIKLAVKEDSKENTIEKAVIGEKESITGKKKTVENTGITQDNIVIKEEDEKYKVQVKKRAESYSVQVKPVVKEPDGVEKREARRVSTGREMLLKAQKAGTSAFMETVIVIIDGMEKRQDMFEELIKKTFHFVERAVDNTDKRYEDIQNWVKKVETATQEESSLMKGAMKSMKKEMAVLIERETEIKLNEANKRWERRLEEFKKRNEKENKAVWELKSGNIDRIRNQLSQRLEREEKIRKRNNIIVEGLTIYSKDEISDWFRKELNLNVSLKGWWRVGGKTDMIGVELSSKEEKEEIMRKKATLKGSNVFINNDLTWEERKRRKEYRDKRRAERGEEDKHT